MIQALSFTFFDVSFSIILAYSCSTPLSDLSPDSTTHIHHAEETSVLEISPSVSLMLLVTPKAFRAFTTIWYRRRFHDRAHAGDTT